MPKDDDWESLVKAQKGLWKEVDGFLITPYGAFKLKKHTPNDRESKERV